MRRDMDLIRKILLELEDHEGYYAWRAQVEGYTDEQVNYHVRLLAQAGFIEMEERMPPPYDLDADSLVWDGHEFLAAIRNESIWNAAKERWQEQFVSIPFQVLVPLVIQIFKQQLGLSGE